MVRDEPRLSAAKKSYKSAKEEGNRQEEARWANVIGDILKNRGEYVEALKWLRIDYDVSVRYLTERHLIPTCQSLGEVYLRLEYFKDALLYQKKHLELAKDSGDIVEQQRASTQLGRTYYEMLLRSEDDHYSVRNAKKYFKFAMKLAQTLKDNPPPNNSSFLKEYIDAHNNIGMLEIELDNLEEARKILTRGLQICDEEEVMENDDGRSRLHHNLGNVYMELRMWEEAREHIEKDIIICKRIGHCQGEAKGYINLGELHNRVHKYGDALLCYQKAIDLAKSMEDEDALVRQIDENIEIVKGFINITDELKREELNLKKLVRGMSTAKGTPTERKCLLKQNNCLDCLIEKSRTTSAWLKLRDYAKRKKKVTSQLHDKEKLSDSFLVIGESYQKLRKFSKAIKWYKKSWETYKSIGNLEGQALAKINIGNVLDSDGDWQGALDAFEESYRIAVEVNVPHVQLSALENMHYSHMIRFDNVEEARRLQLLIDRLKRSENKELKPQNVADCCSETDTEGDNHLSNKSSRASYSSETSRSTCNRSEPLPGEVELDDDTTLLSLIRPVKRPVKMKTACTGRHENSAKLSEVSPKSLSKTTGNQQTVVGRKRVRLIISDDEEELYDYSKGATIDYPMEDVATSSEHRNKSIATSPVFISQDTKRAFKSYSPVNIEENSSSYKNINPYATTQCNQVFKSSSADEVALASDIATSNSKCETYRSENRLHDQKVSHLKLHPSGHEHDKYIIFKIGKELIHIAADSFVANDKLNIDSVKVELACLYYLQLPMEKRSEGLFPIIQHIKCGEKVIDSLQTIEAFKDNAGEFSIEAVVDGWVQKRLIKLYIECCKEASALLNMKLLKKLYYLGVSDDEVIVPGCELQDLSITPLLNALHVHKTFAILDISHNLLGNGTMEKLQQVFTSSGQNYGGLTLDLHCNRFGPTALFQICECPMLFARLEVLNVSGNRLTDACASYLYTILKSCFALCSLNIERCCITSRTIQKIADALTAESALEQISIGHNSPISGNAIISLLAKLATSKRFSKLNLNGLKLSKPVVDSLCHLAKGSCLSTLMLGETGIGNDGALQIAESLLSESEDGVKLDLSYSGLTSKFTHKLSDDVSLFCCILELNLSGNPLMQEGSNAISSFLTSSHCCLKVLFLNKCQLGVAGILQIIQALAGDNSLQELFLADNADLGKHYTQQVITIKDCSDILQPNLNMPESAPNLCLTEADLTAHGICHVNTDCNQLEVPDSEDDNIRDEPAASGMDDSCATSYPNIFSSPECQWIQELSIANSKAKSLRLLDLSNNGISKQAAEMLYSAWSSSRDSACRHIKDQIIHLSVQGNKCCVKSCCRKD